MIFQGIDIVLNQNMRCKQLKNNEVIYILLEIFTIIGVFLHLFLDETTFLYVVLLRLIPIKQCWLKIQEKIQLNDCILRLMIIVSLLYHYMTCIRMKYIEDISIQFNIGYIKAFYKIINSPVIDQQNIPEIYFESVLGLLNLIVLFLIVSEAVKYNLGIELNTFKSNKKIQTILDSQKNIGVSTQMLGRLKKYLQIELPKIELNDIKWERLTNSLDRQIKDEIQYDIFYDVLKQSQILSNICTQECLLKLCSLIEYSKESEVKVTTQKLFILVKGYAQSTLSTPFNNKWLNEVEGTKILNEISFLSQDSINVNIKLSPNSKIATLSYDAFIQTIRQNDVCFQKFYMLKDNIKFSKQNILSDENFDVYLQQMHPQSILNQLKIDRLALIREYNRDFYQDRRRLYRSDKNRFNSRLNQNLIAILAMGFGIQKGYHKDQELTNEVMNLLKGNITNYDDSLFNTDNIDEKTSKTTQVYDKQLTYNTYNTRTDKVEFTQKSYTSNINVNSDEQPSIHTTSLRIKQPEIKSATASSIKINFLNSNVSELVPSPSQQLKQFESRIAGSKKSSAASSAQQSQPLRPILSSSPYQLQQTLSSVRYNNNDNQTFPYQSQINISQQVPSPTIEEIENPSVQASSQRDFMYHKNGKRRFGFDVDDFDQAKVYKFFYPEFNLPLILHRIKKRMITVGTSATPINFILRNENKKETNEISQRNNLIIIQDEDSKDKRKLRLSKTEIN